MDIIDLIDNSESQTLTNVYTLLKEGNLTEEAIAVKLSIKLTDVQEYKRQLIEAGMIEKKVKKSGRPVGFSPQKSLKSSLISLNQCIVQECAEGATLSLSIQMNDKVPQIRIKIIKEEEL